MALCCCGNGPRNSGEEEGDRNALHALMLGTFYRHGREKPLFYAIPGKISRVGIGGKRRKVTIITIRRLDTAEPRNVRPMSNTVVS